VLARGNPWALQVWLDGLSQEEAGALQIQAGFEAVRNAAEKLAEALKPLWEAIEAAARAMVEIIVAAIKPILWSVPFRRLALYLALRRRRVPDRLAGWVAVRCPVRWLPDLSGP
jgi:hypothetical protein